VTRRFASTGLVQLELKLHKGAVPFLGEPPLAMSVYPKSQHANPAVGTWGW
jgi:hypothetical protein